VNFAENPTVFLPLLPLDGAVILPGMSVTLPVTTEEESAALAAATDGRVVLVPRLEGRFPNIGVVALVEGEIALPGGLRGVSLEALHRAELGPAQAGGNGLRVRVTERPDPDDPGARAAALGREYRALVEEIMEARGSGAQVVAFLRGIDHPGRLADTAGYSPEIPFEKKVELLETLDVAERLEKAIAAQRDRLADAALRKRIRNEVDEGMEKTQREFLLRRQLEAIRKELGEGDESGGVEDWRRRIAEAEMPEGARREAERELGRLERQ
jgi:ATP-dependent Lon protease